MEALRTELHHTPARPWGEHPKQGAAVRRFQPWKAMVRQAPEAAQSRNIGKTWRSGNSPLRTEDNTAPPRFERRRRSILIPVAAKLPKSGYRADNDC
jgi:hypothetical protein